MADCFRTRSRGLRWDLATLNDFASLYWANSFPKLANSFKQFPCVLYMQMQAPGRAKRNAIRGTERRQLRMWPTHPWETLQNAGPSSDFGWGRGWSPKIKIYIYMRCNYLHLVYKDPSGSWCLRFDDYIFIFSLGWTYNEVMSRLWLQTRTRLLSVKAGND